MSQAISSSSSEARLRIRNSKIETKTQRIVTMTVTVRPARENLQSFSALWRFEQGQQPINSEECSETTEGVARESEGRGRLSLLRPLESEVKCATRAIARRRGRSSTLRWTGCWHG